MPYLVFKGGQQIVSLELDELVVGVRSGEILPTDYCWREGWDEWYPVDTVAGHPAPGAEATPSAGESGRAPGRPNPGEGGEGVAARRVSRKGLVVAGASVLGLFAVTVFASPWWTLHRIRRAVERNDAGFVAGQVDFPRFRESLKAVLTEGAAAGGDAPLTATGEGPARTGPPGRTFGARLIDSVVDALITPEALVGLLEGRESGLLLNGGGSASGTAPRGTGTGPGGNAGGVAGMRISSPRYETPNRFAVTLAGAAEAGNPGPGSVNLLLSRRGLWRWQVTGIRIERR